MGCEETGHWKKWCPKANPSNKNDTDGNSICFSGLNDLSTIPAILTEILENENFEYRSEQKYTSVKKKLKVK